MEICLEVQQEIDRGRISCSAPGEISISEVLNALESEPEESKIPPYFQSTKGGL